MAYTTIAHVNAKFTSPINENLESTSVMTNIHFILYCSEEIISNLNAMFLGTVFRLGSDNHSRIVGFRLIFYANRS